MMVADGMWKQMIQKEWSAPSVEVRVDNNLQSLEVIDWTAQI
jgi:hypothetical protein